MGKTPFQKHREEEERRKKREEEEAAKIYESFVESFGETPEESGAAPKSFVRGGTIQPGSAAKDGGSGGKKAPKYVPSFMPPQMAAALGKPEPQEAAQSSGGSVFPLPSTARGDRGKTRNIDKMLETMKREQEAREERQRLRRERGPGYEAPGAAIDDGLGSFDDGDPFTTNLYVGNLAPEVDEEVLKREFLRYGDIASIKVMWPRDEDQRRRARNCGFVAFMTRESAERAKEELNGVLLRDLDLKIGWGKAVVLPPIPMYTSSGLGGLAPMMAAARAITGHVPPVGQQKAAWAPPEAERDPHEGIGPDIAVRPPKDERARFIIDSTACYVLADGCDFEQALMVREADNPEFMFLFDLGSPEHAYYRWRVYSLTQGDSLRSWRNEPFVMVEGGPRWLPPSMTAVGNGRQQTAAQRGGEAKDKDRPLSDVQRDKFEDLLRGLTMERASICEAMVFAIDNAESAFEVVEILSDSLTLSETPMTTKVARLMLASDVLHNSSAQVRNASRYRNLLEASLPDVFESLQVTYRSLGSRMEQEVLRRHVLRLLRVWRSWFIFSDDYLNGLQATFLKGKSGNADNPKLRAELAALDADSLAIRCRRNGLSREGDQAAQIQRLINLQAYLAGDIKAEPLSGSHTPRQEPSPVVDEALGIFSVNAEAAKEVKAEPQAPVLGPPARPPAVKMEAEKKVEPNKKAVEGPVSKWTLVDYEEESAFAQPEEAAADEIFPEAEKTPVADVGQPGSPPAEASARDAVSHEGDHDGRAGGERMDAAEEGRRARLRQVEVELLLFREGLEDQGLSKEEVENRVAAQREKLVAATEQPSTSTRDGKNGGTEPAERQKSPQREHKRSREKEKTSKDREHERDRDKERERERRDRGKEEKAGSRDKERHHKESSREKERQRERERERERGKEKEQPRQRRRSRSRSRERRRSRSRSRGRDRARDERRRDGDGRTRDKSRSPKRSRR